MGMQCASQLSWQLQQHGTGNADWGKNADLWDERHTPQKSENTTSLRILSLTKAPVQLYSAFVAFGVAHEGRRASLEQNWGNVREKTGASVGRAVGREAYSGCLAATRDEENGAAREQAHETCLVCKGLEKIGAVAHSLVLWEWFSKSTRRIE
ncbi:hypothetical protein C8J57DRAFT_1261746 [Mycena rebaudengoi]|nr:hypothetical protein C8J57DRAFT_1261746 [Mycena rebaudengoi]